MRRRLPRTTNERALAVAAGVIVVFIAVVARFHHLGAYHTHWDEGVHAYYAWQFFDTGRFTYEAWRHGPLLYYLSAPLAAVTKDLVLGGRAVVAALSLGVFPALYLLRRDLPRSALWFAATVLAVHPYVLATARFFRNDALLATACLLLIGLYAAHRRSPSWPSAAAIGVTLGVALATKEAVYLLLPALVLPVVVAAHFEGRHADRSAVAVLDAYLPLRYAPVISGTFVVAVIALYGGWPPRPLDAFPSLVEGITYWLDEGGSGDPDLAYYAGRLVGGAPVVSGLAALGAVGTIVRSNSAWLRWVFLSWAAFALLLFSLVADQSWWILVLIFTPTVVLAGCGLHDGWLLARRVGQRLRATLELESRPRARTAASVAGPILAAVLVMAASTAVVGLPRDVAGLTEGATPDHQQEAFGIARSAALETGCGVDVGPDAYDWPGRWWLRGIDVDDPDEADDIRDGVVVIDRGPLEALNDSAYTTTSYRRWTIYTPVTDCGT